LTTKVYEPLADWSEIRDQAIELMDNLYATLAHEGFVGYRHTEMIHPETGRHIRRGFAGGEWTISASTIPMKRGRRGTAVDAVDPAQVRLDLRHIKRSGRGLPSAQDLVKELI